MSREQEGYGMMSLRWWEMAHTKVVAGRVFGYQLDYSGQVAQRRDATADRDAWEKCLDCPELDGCYRLSMGTMLMELVLKTSAISLYQNS